jgi:hypothetical protein
MRYGRLVPVLLAFMLGVGGSFASPVRGAEGPKAVEAELETPFVLGVGETGKVEPEGLEVTFRSASDDSGCMTPTDCSIATFKGTIAMRLDEDSDLASIQAIMKPDQWMSMTFQGYVISFSAVHQASKDRLEATFTVVKAEEKDEEEEEAEEDGGTGR